MKRIVGATLATTLALSLGASREPNAPNSPDSLSASDERKITHIGYDAWPTHDALCQIRRGSLLRALGSGAYEYVTDDVHGNECADGEVVHPPEQLVQQEQAVYEQVAGEIDLLANTKGLAQPGNESLVAPVSIEPGDALRPGRACSPSDRATTYYLGTLSTDERLMAISTPNMPDAATVRPDSCPPGITYYLQAQ